LPDWLIWPGLVLVGVGVGAYGTMIGAGGGFVLVPILLLLYPDDSPELITSISLAVVFFSALSGTTAYVAQRRVDFLAANAFAAATIPGAIAGALAVGLLPREIFDPVFAALLLGVGVFLIVKPVARIRQRRHRRGEVSRLLTDRAGDTYAYSYNLVSGIGLSLFVGFISSLFGIGGGIIHVPLLVQVLLFPAHIATATSQYVLMVSAFVGTVVHLASGDLSGGYPETGALALGVVAGAQVGARVSMLVRGPSLIRLLAGALILVALRLLLTPLL
jgi:uncharacterized membrane protein YfcA